MTGSSHAIVLGGTDDHRALLDALRGRGFRTVLLDPSPSPRAQPSADVHIQANALDMDLVEAIAREHKADVVISLCVDQAFAVACRVSERLGTPAPLRGSQAQDVTNKARMKELMVRAGIPTAAFSIHDEALASLPAGNHYPVMVKPVDGNGSQGVRRVLDAGDLAEAIAFARDRSREGRVVLEDYVDGVEVSIDCFVRNGIAQVLHVGRLQRKAADASTLLICRWASHARISEQAHARIRMVAARIAEAFHLTTTPLLIQAIITDDEVSVVEFSPRVGGGSKHQVLSHVTGVDMIEHGLAAYLGEDTRPMPTEAGYRYVQGFIHSLPGSFDKVTGLDALSEAGVITDFFMYINSGTQVDAVLASRSRVGAFLVEGRHVDEAEMNARTAIEALEVLDCDGSPRMRKDLLRGTEWV